MKTKIISLKALEPFGAVDNLNSQAMTLVNQQKTVLETAARNYEALSQIQTKTFHFDRFRIITQFNPERIRSTAAKTDAATVAARPCFLCAENLHPNQQGLLFNSKYMILANPYPIFPNHLTIASLEHGPQEILPNIGDMLDLSQNLPGFTVFYNGPQCGASAPDHLHFQAGNTGLMPIDSEVETIIESSAEMLSKNIIASDHCLRKAVILYSSDKNQLVENFHLIYNILNNLTGNTDHEPKMNILCKHTNNGWRITVFPREKQHTSHFFKTDSRRIVTGPAAVEFGGIMVLPREEDFIKITKTDIVEIYSEATINSDKYDSLVRSIKTSKNSSIK